MFLSSNNMKGYVVLMEEDFGPKDNHWYSAAKKKLLNNIIYVGESNIGRIKSNNDDNRITCASYRNTTRLGNPEVWTDGGFYFSTGENLKIIEEKMNNDLLIGKPLPHFELQTSNNIILKDISN